ncbi:hypothetical protein SO694_00134073 [Aureococcus anophagefferens]|uniref:Uncharacterized protein n=1 Tax=Aureococcus anophagefferens TaxID=44056 RepID=A0ABR1GFV0_AURAN
MPRVRLVVALSAFAAASLERASTLEEWLGAMTLDPGVDFETTIAGTSLEITDLTCEDLKITGALAAAYEARARARPSRASRPSARARTRPWTSASTSAPTARRADDAAIGRGDARWPSAREARGDALGSLLDGFTDAIVGFYDEQIADAICAALAGAVSADLTGISPSCGGRRAGDADAARALAETFDAAPAYVDWAHLLANGTGPGAAVARAPRTACAEAARLAATSSGCSWTSARGWACRSRRKRRWTSAASASPRSAARPGGARRARCPSPTRR